MILDDFGAFWVVPKVEKCPLFNEDRPTVISNGESTQLNSAFMMRSFLLRHGSVQASQTVFQTF